MESNVTIRCPADQEKALALYLKRKGSDLETEMTYCFKRLYEKHVPTSVREYIDGLEIPTANN